jgi:hypothetical protein
MGAEDVLSCSQYPTIDPHLEPDESNSRPPPSYFFKTHSTIILPYTALSSYKFRCSYPARGYFSSLKTKAAGVKYLPNYTTAHFRRHTLHSHSYVDFKPHGIKEIQCEGVYWIQLAHDRDEWRSLVIKR